MIFFPVMAIPGGAPPGRWYPGAPIAGIGVNRAPVCPRRGALRRSLSSRCHAPPTPRSIGRVLREFPLPATVRERAAAWLDDAASVPEAAGGERRGVRAAATVLL